MLNKTNRLIIFIIYSISLIVISFLFAKTKYAIDENTTTKFNYIGSDSINEDICDIRSFYAIDADPLGVYNRPYGVVPDETVAVEIAEKILFSLYGTDNIQQQRPYSVSLMNNRFWCINGNLNKSKEGGTFCILLDKTDCRVIKIVHGK